MSALVERIIAARDRIKHLMNYGEDAVWRPAKEAHEVMADAANALAAQARSAGPSREPLRAALTAWDRYEPNISRTDVVVQATAMATAIRLLLAEEGS